MAYGSPMVHAQLQRLGRVVNHKNVARLMRVNGIVGVFKPAKGAPQSPLMPTLRSRIYRNAGSPQAPQTSPGSEIFLRSTDEGWLYIASVIDLGSRRLIGYSMADHMQTELVADALTMAARSW